MNDLQRIARQVLTQRMEARRINAVLRRQEKNELERYEAELNLICDDLVQEGFVYGSAAMWEAALKTMAARHMPERNDGGYAARMKDTGF